MHFDMDIPSLKCNLCFYLISGRNSISRKHFSFLQKQDRFKKEKSSENLSCIYTYYIVCFI